MNIPVCGDIGDPNEPLTFRCIEFTRAPGVRRFRSPEPRRSWRPSTVSTGTDRSSFRCIASMTRRDASLAYSRVRRATRRKRSLEPSPSTPRIPTRQLLTSTPRSRGGDRVAFFTSDLSLAELAASSDPSLAMMFSIASANPNRTSNMVLFNRPSGGPQLAFDGSPTNGFAWDDIVVNLSAAIAVPAAPPIADAGADVSVGQGQSVSFSGLTSTDQDGVIVAYAWDFGDGASADTASVTHDYALPGVYTATLTVTDDDGKTGVDTVQVTVANRTPSV